MNIFITSGLGSVLFVTSYLGDDRDLWFNVIYFIPSSEFNAYLKQSDIVYNEKISYCFTSGEYDFYFLHCSKQRIYARQIRQLTSHFDVTFELMNANLHATSVPWQLQAALLNKYFFLSIH